MFKSNRVAIHPKEKREIILSICRDIVTSKSSTTGDLLVAYKLFKKLQESSPIADKLVDGYVGDLTVRLGRLGTLDLSEEVDYKSVVALASKL